MSNQHMILQKETFFKMSVLRFVNTSKKHAEIFLEANCPHQKRSQISLLLYCCLIVLRTEIYYKSRGILEYHDFC